MISIHGLRSVYTFLDTMINGNVIASFVQKKAKVLRFCGPKRFILRMYATLKPLPTPLVRNRMHLA